MTQTSRESFRKLDKQQVESEAMQILSFLTYWQPQRYSLRDIAEATHLALNVCWSRVNTLHKRGVIEYAGVMYDANTKRDVQVWRAKH